jgi:hypothetical protein
MSLPSKYVKGVGINKAKKLVKENDDFTQMLNCNQGNPELTFSIGKTYNDMRFLRVG